MPHVRLRHHFIDRRRRRNRMLVQAQHSSQTLFAVNAVCKAEFPHIWERLWDVPLAHEHSAEVWHEIW